MVTKFWCRCTVFTSEYVLWSQTVSHEVHTCTAGGTGSLIPLKLAENHNNHRPTDPHSRTAQNSSSILTKFTFFWQKLKSRDPIILEWNLMAHGSKQKSRNSFEMSIHCLQFLMQVYFQLFPPRPDKGCFFPNQARVICNPGDLRWSGGGFGVIRAGRRVILASKADNNTQHWLSVKLAKTLNLYYIVISCVIL